MTADITSPSNERIKRLVRLKKPSNRNKEGVFVVEGARILDRALEAGHTPVEVYTDDLQRWGHLPNTLTVDTAVLDKASYRQVSEGVIAVIEQFPTGLSGFHPGKEPFLLIAERIEKPGNFGAMVRTADALGVDGLIGIGPGVDVFNPNVLRSSTGALFTVPIAVTDIEGLGSWVAKQHLTVFASSPDAETSMWDVDLTGGIALAVGAEDLGISDGLTFIAHQTVRIPMSGRVDSLNASVSLAILGYEALRQREAS